MPARRSYEWRARMKTPPGVAAQRITTEHPQHSARCNSPQQLRAIRVSLSAAQWKALYVALYCHRLLPTRSLIVLFRRHSEWVHA